MPHVGGSVYFIYVSVVQVLVVSSSVFISVFLCAKAGTAVAHLSRRNSILSVHPSHMRIRQKRCKPNLHCQLPGWL